MNTASCPWSSCAAEQGNHFSCPFVAPDPVFPLPVFLLVTRLRSSPVAAAAYRSSSSSQWPFSRRRRRPRRAAR